MMDFKEWKGRCTPNTVRNLISRLEALGNRLYDRYDNILDKIPQHAKEDAMNLFKWLIIAGRPLSVKEASIALGLNRTHSSLGALQSDIDRDMGADKLRKLCGPLIHVDESIGRVTLLHYSVKEYLIDATRPDNKWRITLQDALKQTTRDCITFLSFNEFSSSVLHPKDHFRPYTYDPDTYDIVPHPDNPYENDHCLLRNLPFLKYAVTQWVNHFKACQEALLKDPDCRRILTAFLIEKEKNVELFFRLYQYFGNTRSSPEAASPLHVVCYFGLEALVPFFTQTSAPKSQDPTTAKKRCSPLEMGALGGHRGVIEQLLKLPQHAHDNRDVKNALSVAVDCGHMAVVECLLQHFPPSDSLSPLLESASAGGHTDIAELLLKKGADVNQGGKYSCPLEAAAYHGHLDMVRMLIRWKADINRFQASSAHGYGSALYAAAAEDHLGIVEELLENGVDVNRICGVHGTALQAAAYAGSMGVVKRLLDAKAINYRCGQYGGALQAALHVGQDDIVRVLEDAGYSPFDRRPVEQSATLDDHAIQGLNVFEKEIELGRIDGAHRRAGRIIRNISSAIERKNSRCLGFLLAVGVEAFEVAVKSGNENFLEFLTKTGMMLLKKTVVPKPSDETVQLSRAWAKALLWTVGEGDRPNIARRMLELCVGDFQGLVDEGRNQDAEELVYAAIEILLATTEIENPKLIGIFLDVFIAALEKLMDGRFEKRTLEIIDEYATKFRDALIRNNSTKDRARARVLAIAGSLALRNAVENQKVKVTQHLTKMYKEILQWIVESGQATDLLIQLGSYVDNQTSPATEICLMQEALLVVTCLLQMETEDQNWRKIFRGLVSGILIQILTAAETIRKLDAVEAHVELWAKGIVRARPGGSIKEHIRFVFEVTRDESTPPPSERLRVSLERIIIRINGISKVDA
ncbi:ankyrin [Choiromyces venosus 120613-1]|uniref:Ankyrin n=1 Tax=Choiromyces venosus 120613-1 TaxID=1336337 RepID=A0A3N4K5T8_9PEZI|nr:ankyrin [Choiromyces venosus 120613-1]